MCLPRRSRRRSTGAARDSHGLCLGLRLLGLPAPRMARERVPGIAQDEPADHEDHDDAEDEEAHDADQARAGVVAAVLRLTGRGRRRGLRRRRLLRGRQRRERAVSGCGRLGECRCGQRERGDRRGQKEGPAGHLLRRRRSAAAAATAARRWPDATRSGVHPAAAAGRAAATRAGLTAAPGARGRLRSGRRRAGGRCWGCRSSARAGAGRHGATAARRRLLRRAR